MNDSIIPTQDTKPSYLYPLLDPHLDPLLDASTRNFNLQDEKNEAAETIIKPPGAKKARVEKTVVNDLEFEPTSSAAATGATKDL